MNLLHKHHKIPRHMGGSDDPDNIELLTIEEHAEAHRLLYLENGHLEDRLAWRGLAGLISKDELLQELCVMGAKRGVRASYLSRFGKEMPEGNVSRPPRQRGIGKGTNGRKWFHDPISGKRMSLRQTEKIPEGWISGTGKRNKKSHRWYTNGTQDIQCEPGKEPRGWKPGRKPTNRKRIRGKFA